MAADPRGEKAAGRALIQALCGDVPAGSFIEIRTLEYGSRSKKPRSRSRIFTWDELDRSLRKAVARGLAAGIASKPPTAQGRGVQAEIDRSPRNTRRPKAERNADGLTAQLQEEIRTALTEQGLSQGDLARRLGRAPSAVSRWLNSPSVTTRVLEGAAAALNIKIRPIGFRDGTA